MQLHACTLKTSTEIETVLLVASRAQGASYEHVGPTMRQVQTQT